MENNEVKHGTVDLDIKVISRELVAEGYTKKVECNNYWDSHGKAIPWGKEVYNLERLKKYELYREVREYHFEYVPTQTWEFLFLYIDGEKLEVGEITKCTELKTKVKLEVCVGAG